MSASPSSQEAPSQHPLFNWQSTYKTWSEKIFYIYENDVCSDFKFIVGVGEEQTIFKAHKLIFALNSPEFVNLFYLLNADVPEIILPENDPGTFIEFMNFIYTGNCMISIENVIELLNLAKLYSILQLTEGCDNFLESWVDQTDVLNVFYLTNSFELPKFELKCLRIIAKFCDNLFAEPDFYNIQKESLKKILEYEMLPCKEFQIFKAVDIWAEFSCKQIGLEVTPINKRNQLGDLISKIRFETMSFDEFGMCSSGSAFLTDRAIVEIVRSLPKTTMNIRKRMGQLPMYRCLRFPAGPSKKILTSIGGRSHFNVTVNKSIYLCGYGIFGMLPEAIELYRKFDVDFSLFTDQRLLTQNCESVNFDGSRDPYDLYFKSPVKLEPAKLYTVFVNFTGPANIHQHFIGDLGETEIHVNGIDFKITTSTLQGLSHDSSVGSIASLIFTN